MRAFVTLGAAAFFLSLSGCSDELVSKQSLDLYDVAEEAAPAETPSDEAAQSLKIGTKPDA